MTYFRGRNKGFQILVNICIWVVGLANWRLRFFNIIMYNFVSLEST